MSFQLALDVRGYHTTPTKESVYGPGLDASGYYGVYNIDFAAWAGDLTAPVAVVNGTVYADVAYLPLILQDFVTGDVWQTIVWTDHIRTSPLWRALPAGHTFDFKTHRLSDVVNAEVSLIHTGGNGYEMVAAFSNRAWNKFGTPITNATQVLFRHDTQAMRVGVGADVSFPVPLRLRVSYPSHDIGQLTVFSPGRVDTFPPVPGAGPQRLQTIELDLTEDIMDHLLAPIVFGSITIAGGHTYAPAMVVPLVLRSWDNKFAQILVTLPLNGATHPAHVAGAYQHTNDETGEVFAMKYSYSNAFADMTQTTAPPGIDAAFTWNSTAVTVPSNQLRLHPDFAQVITWAPHGGLPFPPNPGYSAPSFLKTLRLSIGIDAAFGHSTLFLPGNHVIDVPLPPGMHTGSGMHTTDVMLLYDLLLNDNGVAFGQVVAPGQTTVSPAILIPVLLRAWDNRYYQTLLAIDADDGGFFVVSSFHNVITDGISLSGSLFSNADFGRASATALPSSSFDAAFQFEMLPDGSLPPQATPHENAPEPFESDCCDVGPSRWQRYYPSSESRICGTTSATRRWHGGNPGAAYLGQ